MTLRRLVLNALVAVALAVVLTFLFLAHLSTMVKPEPTATAHEQIDFNPGTGRLP